jgi:hypothetical protein
MNRRAVVNLNPIYKGSDWSVSFPLTRNGASFLGDYTSFTTVMRESDEETGTSVTIASAGRVLLTDYFNITLTDTVTAALTCERVYWEVKGVLPPGSPTGIIEPIAKGYVEVETGAAAV